jgi:hypothetical protein
MQETHPSASNMKLRNLLAIGIPCLLGWAFSYLATNIFRGYAWGLFIWLPLVMGATSTLIYGYNNTVERKKLRNISLWTLLIFCLGLLVFAWEGIICLLMVAPMGLACTWIGHLIGYEIIKKKMSGTPTAIILLFLSVPSFMAFEDIKQEKQEVRSVISSIEINAPPQEVWKNVIAFPQLKDPTEFIFKTGIAYPINATIKGEGIGAVRHCNFSTGSFVEPITVWDQPRLLKFSVDEQPAPMKELSFYDIQPNHLHGYWVSKEGQFKLIQLANGHTLLEGTTWYENKIKPDFYWTLWSDFIVHKIHQRVLKHIKEQTEKRML